MLYYRKFRRYVQLIRQEGGAPPCAPKSSFGRSPLARSLTAVLSATHPAGKIPVHTRSVDIPQNHRYVTPQRPDSPRGPRSFSLPENAKIPVFRPKMHIKTQSNHFYMHECPFQRPNPPVFQNYHLESPRFLPPNQQNRPPNARIRPYRAYEKQKSFELYAFSCENESWRLRPCGADLCNTSNPSARNQNGKKTRRPPSAFSTNIRTS